MEKFAISEESLEQVVGGVKSDKSRVKKILIGAGIVAASLIAGAGAVSYVLIKNKKANKNIAAGNNDKTGSVVVYDKHDVPCLEEAAEYNENSNGVWNEYIND